MGAHSFLQVIEQKLKTRLEVFIANPSLGHFEGLAPPSEYVPIVSILDIISAVCKF